MIDCCVISLVLCGVILAMLTMFFNYNLKLKDQSLELSQRTSELEKKNGAEQHQIDELKGKLESLEALIGKAVFNSVPNAPIPPAPPAPPIAPISQPKPQPKSPSVTFVQELQEKQNQGKLKPSEFKKS